MYTKQELDVVGTYSADTVRDEDLLSMAKYMYKEGLLKASVKYDPDTDSNIMEYIDFYYFRMFPDRVIVILHWTYILNNI